MANKFILFFIAYIATVSLMAQTDSPKSSISNLPNASIAFDKISVCNGSYLREIRPYDYQLIPRKTNNTGTIRIAGLLIGSGNIYFKVIKKSFDQSQSFYVYPIAVDPGGHFNAEIDIHAELAEYSISYSTNENDWTIIASNVVCGDVFLISGQSNASADSDIEQEVRVNLLYGNYDENQYGKYCRTYKKWGINPNSGWSYSEVSGQYGVGVWGLKLQYELQKTNGVPTCLINGSVGGTGMHQHFVFEQDPFYHVLSPPEYLFGSLLTRVYYAGLQEDIKAIIWFNGEAECGSFNPETGIYTRDFDKLYHSSVDYLSSFEQMYVIQVSSYSGGSVGIGFVSEDQRLLPEFYEKLKVMSSNGIGNKNPNEGEHIHFSAEAYEELGQRMFNLIERDIYSNGLIDSPEPPDVLKARKEGNRIFIDFDQILNVNFSDPLDNVLSVINFNIPNIVKYNAGIEGNSLFFDVDSGVVSLIEEVSYAGFLPNNEFDLKCYLRNSDSVAALSFYKLLFTEGGNPISIGSHLVPAFEFTLNQNSVSDIAVISLPEACGVSKIKLYNTSGQLLLEDTFSGVSYSLDCSNRNSGIYLLHVTNKCGFGNKKFVVY